MNNVVRFESTKRKLGWQDEKEMKVSKREDRKRRDNQRINRNMKWGDDSTD